MITALDLAKGTDPCRNWYRRERFYLVQEQPALRVHWRLGRLRVLIWGPRFFASVSWRRRDAVQPADPLHFRAWQVYCGWGKCDATRTQMLRRGELGGDPDGPEGYVLTWTLKEMLALRSRLLDETPHWTNQGGA